MKAYTDYSDFLARIFKGIKVQKLTIDAGHSCPNRDGTIGRGGCIYCNNNAFSPTYCHEAGSVSAQIEVGRKFFSHKYPEMQFLAYFQAYTSTHAPLDELIKAYEEAMSCPGICGLVVGTRPDCMPVELLDYLSDVYHTHMPVIIEYGVETVHNDTLQLINRHHTSECAHAAVEAAAERDIPVGVHLIMGLPGETREQMLQTVREVVSWPVSVVKFHQLQVVKGTRLYDLWRIQQINGPEATPGFPTITTFQLEEYLDLCVELIHLVPQQISIERFTAQCPSALLAAPCWHIKNYQFTNRLNNCLLKSYSEGKVTHV
ncbi:MAG: TIGR01212 family radical SAM protein [Muribaculaceae bacterium]|nr:TIGR01212 family radical SAM protein [Muribaculaceae bacterium]